MKPEELVKKYLPTVNIMQLATSSNNQPWACTVHFYSDENLNLYWISTLERRHSQDIKLNPKVAATIMVHENTAEEDYVIGVSIEGTAELLAEKIDDATVQAYISKLSMDTAFMAKVKAGKDAHKFYRLTSSKIVIFDNKDYPDNPRQEFSIES